MTTNSKINRNLDDLHVDDYLNRMRLRDWFEEERDRQGIGNKELATRLNHNTGWAYGIITGGGMWRAASMQRMARALGYTLHFNVDTFGVTPALKDQPSLSDLYAGNPDPEKREEAARMDLGNLGQRLREAKKISSAVLGRMLNQEGESVRAFESGDKPYYLIVTAQRFFRALGGELKFALEAADGTTFEAPVGRWPSNNGSEVNIVEMEDRTLVWNTKSPETVVSFPRSAWKEWISNG